MPGRGGAHMSTLGGLEALSTEGQTKSVRSDCCGSNGMSAKSTESRDQLPLRITHSCQPCQSTKKGWGSLAELQAGQRILRL